MNVEELVRDAFREEAADAPHASPSLADKVLAVRRRNRRRRIVSLAATTLVAVAVAVTVPFLGRGGNEPRPASEMNNSDIIGHPDQSPPRSLIAAGNTVLSAFYVTEAVKQANGDIVSRRVYGLLDQKSGLYEKAKWAYLDVAPGSRTAAVLEGELPARRIGLLDLITGKVDRWIPLDRGVAGVSFSPDGTKLVATTYAKDPDRSFRDHPMFLNGKKVPGPVPSRTGFTVVDVASGKADWHKVAFVRDETGWVPNSRQDFGWSRDGTLVYTGSVNAPYRDYYRLDGTKADWPKDESPAANIEAGVSPDGKLAAGGFAGRGAAVASAIVDPRTGERITTVPVQQLLVWADNKRLIAWGCDPKRCSGKGEFRNQLLLVTVGTDRVVPLSGFRKANDAYPGRWNPVFSSR